MSPMTPDLVGSVAVSRTTNRDCCPHDCMGASKHKASDANGILSLPGGGQEPGHEVLGRVRQVYLSKARVGAGQGGVRGVA